MSKPLDNETLRQSAQRAGLNLSTEELNRLRPGVERARRQAAELREIAGAADEPAGTFSAKDRTGGKP